MIKIKLSCLINRSYYLSYRIFFEEKHVRNIYISIFKKIKNRRDPEYSVSHVWFSSSLDKIYTLIIIPEYHMYKLLCIDILSLYFKLCIIFTSFKKQPNKQQQDSVFTF